MVNENSDKTELLNATAISVSVINGLAATLDDSKFNRVPYEGSWTPAQLLDHVTKSISGMATAIQKKGEPAGRGAGERIEELKKTFLDLNLKMQSPESIVPGNGPFKKAGTMQALNDSLEHLLKNTAEINLEQLVQGLPFGPITRLELLHFVYYHTTRHSYQMKKICDALN